MADALPGGSADRSALHELLRRYPGGRHIAEHVDDGPFHLVPVIEDGNPHVNVQAALDAWPGVPVPYRFTDWSNPEVRLVAIHPVPQFGYELMSWYNDPSDTDFAIDVERVSTPFDTLPGAQQILAALPGWLGFGELDIDDEEDAVAAIDAAIAGSGAAATLAFIGQLPLTGEVTADAATLTAALAALTA